MIVLTLLTKMIACSVILFAYYLLFLRNKRFHHYNRFYLLAATGLSITIPFIKIPIFFESGTAAAQLVNTSIEIISVNRWEDEFAGGSSSGNYISLPTLQGVSIIAYSIVVLIFAILLCRSLFYILRLSKKYPHQYIDTIRFYNTVEPGTPFSFFRSIFWNSNLKFNSKEGQQIFRHELFHVKERHSADILFMEGVSIIFWINPMFHIIKKEIKAIHEFLADQHAVSTSNEQDYAELLVLQSISIKKSSISNYFFQNHIKRRIAMITQFKNKKYGYLSRLLVLPLSAFLFCAIALYAKPPEKPSGTNVNEPPVKQLTVLIDAGHGGTDAGARNDHGLQEKDLALAIAQQIKQQASAFNLNIVMTRTDDAYPTLKERTEKAKSIKADMIVSIHIGTAPGANQNSGFDIYVTNKNQQTIHQSKILAQSIATRIKDLYTTQPIKQRKENGIWILDAAPCPAVLIECGYMSNEKDVAFISDIKNQQKVAKSILEGILSYQSLPQDQQIVDTVPAAKRPTDSLNEVRLQRQSEMAREKKKESHLKAEEAQRELDEARAKMEVKNNDLLIKQKEIEAQQRLVEEKMARDMDRQQRDIARKQKETQEKQQQLVAEMEKKNEALRKKHEEVDVKQETLLEVKKLEEIKKKQELLEERTLEMENKQKLLQQKQEELEQNRLKLAEQDLEKKEKPKPAERPKPGSADSNKKMKPAPKTVHEEE